MAPPDGDSTRGWVEHRAKLDEVLALTCSAIARSYGAESANRLATGFNELGKLRGLGVETSPDYFQRGTALAYALSYLVSRVSSAVAILDYALDRADPLQRVFDIGSGSDATRLALEWLRPLDSIRFVTTEPSRDMTNFAQIFHSHWRRHVGDHPGIARQRLACSLEQICDGMLPANVCDLDLVVMSACLPYGYDQSGRLLEKLVPRMVPGAFLIAVEPLAKRKALDGLASAFEIVTGRRPQLLKSSDLQSEYTRVVRLPKASEVLNELATDVWESDFDSTEPVLDLLGESLLSAVHRSGVLAFSRRPECYLVARNPISL